MLWLPQATLHSPCEQGYSPAKRVYSPPARRCFGYMISKKKYIYTIDDDCFVAKNPTGEDINALEQHIKCVCGTNGWVGVVGWGGMDEGSKSGV